MNRPKNFAELYYETNEPVNEFNAGRKIALQEIRIEAIKHLKLADKNEKLANLIKGENNNVHDYFLGYKAAIRKIFNLEGSENEQTN